MIFGNLGQDDIIGGSSNLFGATPDLRPDASDLIFGGAGTDIGRNDMGDTSTTGHARDADMILGDNGTIFRLVGAGTSPLAFNYDNYNAGTGSLNKIVVRAARLLDYTPGGSDFNATAAALDIGGPDEIHGESGDDSIYGMRGDDTLFGKGQDDNIVGGYGNDWISGGAGDDGRPRRRRPRLHQPQQRHHRRAALWNRHRHREPDYQHAGQRCSWPPSMSLAC